LIGRIDDSAEKAFHFLLGEPVDQLILRVKLDQNA